MNNTFEHSLWALQECNELAAKK